jgi:hypothetical protein
MARTKRALNGFARFLGGFKNFVDVLVDPEARCLVFLAFRNLFSRSSDEASVAKKKHVKAAKAA